MTKTTQRYVGWVAGFLAMSVGPSLPAYPQQAIERGAAQNSQPGGVKKPTKPVTAKPAAARSLDMRAPQTPQWTLDDALPSRTRTRETPIVSSPALGRVPVEGGSFGFSTETKVDPYRTPDGNRIRGLDTGKADPSYLGLSLSVTTDDKSMLPRTIFPNW
jgi:hypothetical protein